MAVPFQVTFDAVNPARLGAFWALALDYVEPPPPEGFRTWQEFAVAAHIEGPTPYALIDPDGLGPRLYFQPVPEPKAAKNRIHLDVNVSSSDHMPERMWQCQQHAAYLVEHGAREIAQMTELGQYWIVMQDPEGNEFCVQ